MNDEKQLCLEVTLITNGKLGNSYVCPLKDFANLEDLCFDGAEPGETYQIKLIEMSADELADLDEFEGF